jgi:hypothetical protein
VSGLLVAALYWGSQPSTYPELITALNRHQDEFGPTIGTWNYTVGDANYQVAFSHYDSNEIN